MMTMAWVTAWTHVFTLLQDDQVDWYAVVTYEALISHHDQVRKELMEVVRSGIKRHNNQYTYASNNLNGYESGEDNAASDTKQSTVLGRRQLHYHDYDKPKKEELSNTSNSPSIKHLFPKETSVKDWKACVAKPQCHNMLNRVTRGILPYFGYVNIGRLQGPLSSSPGPVTVSNDFGRVLFSSEGVALNSFRQSQDGVAGGSHIDYKPPLDLIAKMREISSRSEYVHVPLRK